MSPEESDSQEQRRMNRWYLVMYLRVYNQETEELLGHVVDIHKDGLRLVSDNPIPLKRRFQLWIDVPKEHTTHQRIFFEAESMWSGRDVNPDFYDTGFRIINIGASALLQLQLLIEEFKF